MNQVNVMLRVCPTDSAHSTVLNVDSKSRHVVLHNPTAGGATGGHVTAQRHISPPKMFAFDYVFTPDDCLVRVFTLLHAMACEFLNPPGRFFLTIRRTAVIHSRFLLHSLLIVNIKPQFTAYM